jgi:hypothetical protein
LKEKSYGRLGGGKCVVAKERKGERKAKSKLNYNHRKRKGKNKFSHNEII